MILMNLIINIDFHLQDLIIRIEITGDEFIINQKMVVMVVMVIMRIKNTNKTSFKNGLIKILEKDLTIAR